MRSLKELTTIDAYVKAFSNGLAEKVAAQAEPLHDPAKEPVHPKIKDMKIAPFPKQADVITASVKSLDKNKLVILACQMGTGKTCQAIGAIHCHAKPRPMHKGQYTTLVICPPHLVMKWRDEVSKFLGGKARATIIENWDQFLKLRHEHRDPLQPVWYIISETTAKLGYSKRAAVVERAKQVPVNGVKTIQRVLCCPKCDYIARKKDKDRSYATVVDIERSWLTCQGMWCKSCGVSMHHDATACPQCMNELKRCDEPLWQGNQHKVAPCQFAKVKKIDWFDYLVRDEAHGSKSATSIDGHACSVFAARAKYTILLTGTLLAGKSEDLRPLLFRLKPREFVEMGYGWNAEIDFAKAYGRIQTVVRTTEGTKRRTGKGNSTSTQQSVKPGIMPHLYPDFVANYTMFLSLPDLATNLPSYMEETVPIAMTSPMLEAYRDMETKLLDTFRQLYVNNRKLAARMLGPMLEALLTWPDVPFGRKPVTITDDFGNTQHIYLPISLDPTVIYPKEKELIKRVIADKKQGRKTWLYAVRDDTRERLQNILEAQGLKVAHLKATVKPSTRLDWLATHGPKCDIGMCHPKLVETGIELFGPGFNFPTLLWYSTGYQTNTLRQASRRAWRIGQPSSCRVDYLYYAPSAQATAIGVMASKLVAAEAIEGKFSDGGLADECMDEDVAMAVARSLADNIQVVVPKFNNPVAEAMTDKQRLEAIRARVARMKARMGGVA